MERGKVACCIDDLALNMITVSQSLPWNGTFAHNRDRSTGVAGLALLHVLIHYQPQPITSKSFLGLTWAQTKTCNKPVTWQETVSSNCCLNLMVYPGTGLLTFAQMIQKPR
jgi:hypothetical protein